jgi:hypothetical protein
MLTEWPYSLSSELIFGSLCIAFRVLGLTLAEHRPTGPKPFQTPNKTIKTTSKSPTPLHRPRHRRLYGKGADTETP